MPATFYKQQLKTLNIRLYTKHYDLVQVLIGKLRYSRTLGNDTAYQQHLLTKAKYFSKHLFRKQFYIETCQLQPPGHRT